MFIETSAKAGHNVKTLFKRIAQALPGMEGEGAQQQAASQSQSTTYAVSPHKLTGIVIDVNINPSQPQSESGCQC